MKYINEPGYEIPDNTILVLGHSYDDDGFASEIIEPLAGKPKRDWFPKSFYYCLPLVIGNQYGFGIKSMHNFTAKYSGGDDPISFEYFPDEDSHKQEINSHFGNGIITITNKFLLRTPPGINLMTIQPPNYFIEGLHPMTGVVEADNLRMSFTFNLKLTPNVKVTVNKGDIIAAFLPIKRYSVDKYKLIKFSNLYDKEVYDNEFNDLIMFAEERQNYQPSNKDGLFARRYFHGKNMNNELYRDHQKGL